MTPCHFLFLLLKKTFMSLENMISQFEKRAATAAPIGGSIKFEVDGQGILIDGTGETNTVALPTEKPIVPLALLLKCFKNSEMEKSIP
jgi:hypothetical protein